MKRILKWLEKRAAKEDSHAEHKQRKCQPRLQQFIGMSDVTQQKQLPVVPHKAVAEVSKIGNL